MGCTDCADCADCEGFKKQPNMFSLARQGSRGRPVFAHYDEQKLQFSTGCFRGTKQEFLEAIEKKHGDNCFGKDYREFVKQVEKLSGL